MKHVLHEIHGTEACSLRTDKGASVGKSFSCKHAGMLARELLVHPEQEAYLAASHADVTCRHICIRADVPPQFKHEGLAETHDLRVGLSLRVEIRTALSAAHRQCSQGVLESLLEAQELKDGEIDRRVETQTALVRPDGVVELYAVACIGLYLAVVVHPCHLESENPVRLHNPLDNLGCLELGMPVIFLLYCLQNFPYSLKVLFFSAVLGLETGHDFISVHNINVIKSDTLSFQKLSSHDFPGKGRTNSTQILSAAPVFTPPMWRRCARGHPHNVYATSRSPARPAS